MAGKRKRGFPVFPLLLLIGAAVGLYHFVPQLNQTPGSAPAALAGQTAQGALPQVLLVNESHPLPETYSPGELVNLYEQKRHFLLARSDIYLAREAFDAANQMFLQAENENMNGFILTSGYRSREKQAELYADRTDDTVQRPGCSEHETGLAFDVTTRYDTGTFEDTPQFQWLTAHCWDYGFILRYPKEKESVTGIAYEPWHYRYVGREAAAVIRDRGWTLEEYCRQAGVPSVP